MDKYGYLFNYSLTQCQYRDTVGTCSACPIVTDFTYQILLYAFSMPMIVFPFLFHIRLTYLVETIDLHPMFAYLCDYPFLLTLIFSSQV